MKYTRFAVISVFVLMTGCSTLAPQYNASMENTQNLKRSGTSQVTVDAFTASNDKVNHLTIRGGGFASPTNGSYVEYLQKALEQELYDANRLSKNSSVKITGVLMQNEIDASGINVGNAHMEAEFVVRDASKERYRKVQSANIEWPSNFIGAVAIPKAIQEYPRVVQEMLGKLYADPDFQNAIR